MFPYRKKKKRQKRAVEDLRPLLTLGKVFESVNFWWGHVLNVFHGRPDCSEIWNRYSQTFSEHCF